MRTRGFTLIEVLVALAIAAIGLGAALSVVTNSASNTTYLRDRVLASWVADNLITQVRLAPNLPELTRTEGVEEFAGRKWKWQSTVTQTQVEGLRRIDIEIKESEINTGSTLGHLSGFVGRAALNGALAFTGDPFDPALAGTAGGSGGAPSVPATAPIPGQPVIRTR